MTMLHELKCWPQFFEQIVANKKRFELRRRDRPFNVDDVLQLAEYDPGKGFTGRIIRRRVLYMLTHDDVGAFAADSIGPGWCIMSLGWVE